MSKWKWIEKPARTTAAPIALREHACSGAAYVQGDFVQIKHLWYAKLDSDAIDTQVPTSNSRNLACMVKASDAGRHGVIAGVVAWELPHGDFNVEGWVQGGGPGGRRYFSYRGPDGLTEAHKHIRRWAGRRFRVPA